MPRAIRNLKINSGRIWKISHTWTNHSMFLSPVRDNRATASIKALLASIIIRPLRRKKMQQIYFNRGTENFPLGINV